MYGRPWRENHSKAHPFVQLICAHNYNKKRHTQKSRCKEHPSVHSGADGERSALTGVRETWCRLAHSGLPGKLVENHLPLDSKEMSVGKALMSLLSQLDTQGPTFLPLSRCFHSRGTGGRESPKAPVYLLKNARLSSRMSRCDFLSKCPFCPGLGREAFTESAARPTPASAHWQA